MANAPELSPTQHRGQVMEEGGGGIFSRIPIWAWIAGGVVVLYVLYTKFLSGTNSTSNPAISTSPDSTGSNGGTLDNLTTALQDVLNNLQGNGSGSSNTGAPVTARSAATQGPFLAKGVAGGVGAPTAAPISSGAQTMRGAAGLSTLNNVGIR